MEYLQKNEVECRCLQGILGTINSGKSALVHRYLTGSYMQEESPEGRNCSIINDSVGVKGSSSTLQNCDVRLGSYSVVGS